MGSAVRGGGGWERALPAQPLGTESAAAAAAAPQPEEHPEQLVSPRVVFPPKRLNLIADGGAHFLRPTGERVRRVSWSRGALRGARGREVGGGARESGTTAIAAGSRAACAERDKFKGSFAGREAAQLQLEPVA